jgi:hypothetical protein
VQDADAVASDIPHEAGEARQDRQEPEWKEREISPASSRDLVPEVRRPDPQLWDVRQCLEGLRPRAGRTGRTGDMDLEAGAVEVPHEQRVDARVSTRPLRRAHEEDTQALAAGVSDLVVYAIFTKSQHRGDAVSAKVLTL